MKRKHCGQIILTSRRMCYEIFDKSFPISVLPFPHMQKVGMDFQVLFQLGIQLHYDSIQTQGLLLLKALPAPLSNLFFF